VSGIRVAMHKAYGEKQKIISMPPPKRVYIPLSQHTGKPAIAIVSAGDTVQKGQLIGEAG